MDQFKTHSYSKKILKYLLLAGMVYVAASSPRFIPNLIKEFSKQKIPKRKFSDTFNYLKRKGLIKIERDGYDVRISLTSKGKRRAGKYQIDELNITKPKKWDCRWRVVIFDVPAFSRTIRDAFRRKLKDFGFYPLQKSIWAYPYPCENEVKLLRDFFGLHQKQVQVLEVIKLEGEKFLRKHFNI